MDRNIESRKVRNDRKAKVLKLRREMLVRLCEVPHEEMGQVAGGGAVETLCVNGGNLSTAAA